MKEKKSNTKPRIKIVGENGNIFNLIGIASRALKIEGKIKEKEEMTERIFSTAKNYDEALSIIFEYCDPE